MTTDDITKAATSGQPIVAAFDFDGTLTYRDTLLSFLLFSAGIFRTCVRLLPLVPVFIAYLLGRSSRQATKERVLTAFFKGMPIEQLGDFGKRFALKRLNSHVKPEALRRFHWHKEQGHRCILVSATLDVYLRPWTEAMGFDEVLCSIVEVSDGCVTGRLDGLNCWGPEKTRRMDELLGPRSGYQLYAYGDSRGDQEMLSSADHAYFRKIPILES